MNPKKIYGHYMLSANLSNPFEMDNFAFSGSGRDNIINVTSNDRKVRFGCENFIASPLHRYVDFLSNNKIYLHRARLLTYGAEWLRAGINGRAAILTLGAENPDDSGAQSSFCIEFRRFNEWQNIECWTDYPPNANDSHYHFSLVQNYSQINIDEFNLQSVYSGETFTPVLELDLSTSGLYNTYSGGII